MHPSHTDLAALPRLSAVAQEGASGWNLSSGPERSAGLCVTFHVDLRRGLGVADVSRTELPPRHHVCVQPAAPHPRRLGSAILTEWRSWREIAGILWVREKDK